MAELKEHRTVSRFIFRLDDNNCYECRGATYYDEDHDQVPEPALQNAARVLQKQLKEEGYEFEIEFGEKGWIELYLQE